MLSWPSSIEHLCLKYENYLPQDEKYQPPNIILANMFGPEDIFSTNLRILSQQLTTLKLSWLVIGTNLFWPMDAAAQIPYWPKLKTFSLEYNPVTPTGKWLFALAPELQLFPPFRFKAVDDPMNDFYEATGRAAMRMPCLESMDLRPVMAFERHWFEYRVKDGKASVNWGSNPRFEPGERVLGVWREAAMAHTGGELEVCFELLGM
jgi:Family of unknown function (DUF6546)